MNIRIETPRLLLRPFTLNDIEAAYNMNLDQEISIYTGDGGVVNYDEMERRIRGIISEDYMKYGYGRFAVELIGVDSFIGFAGLKYLPEYAVTDLGYRFKKKYFWTIIVYKQFILSTFCTRFWKIDEFRD